MPPRHDRTNKISCRIMTRKQSDHRRISRQISAPQDRPAASGLKIKSACLAFTSVLSATIGGNSPPPVIQHITPAFRRRYARRRISRVTMALLLLKPPTAMRPFIDCLVNESPIKTALNRARMINDIKMTTANASL
ncbi:hypothetical protein KCP74_16110 [Salmonella enterica subsp. enterica]|nr:hypothetical protein KCP74_16110 [Salmonella enterica subsp. enterica]